MTHDRYTSPHAELQLLLRQIGELSPRHRRSPVFTSRNAAERIIAVSATATGAEVALTPVWALDPDDLTESEIVAWTVTSLPN